MAFINNLKDKLTYAYEPELIDLAAFPTTEITTDDTISTLATHSATTFKAADRIQVGYRSELANDSGNDEDYIFVLDFGGANWAQTLSIVDGGTDFVGVYADLVRSSSSLFVGTVSFVHQLSDGTVANYIFPAIIADSGVTEITITATNDTTNSAGFDLSGSGGYIIVDTF